MRYLKRGLLSLGMALAVLVMLSVAAGADSSMIADVSPESLDDIGIQEGTSPEEKAATEAGDEGELYSVQADKPTELFLQRAPERSDYLSFELLDVTGLVLGVRYESGAIDTVSADEVTISYEGADSLRVAHRVAYAEYCGLYVEIPVAVRPREYDLGISFTDKEVEYDGQSHKVDCLGELPVGFDGIPLRAEVVGSGTDVGQYSLTLNFYTESTEYSAPASMTATLTVVPREVRAEWSELDLIYNGEVQAPSAYFTDVLGLAVPLEVLGGGVNAAEGYIATALCRDRNYSIVNDMARFSIGRASYDMSGTVWTRGDFVFNNRVQSVALTGLPDGVTVGEYTGASAISAGEYTASVTLIYDEINYYPPEVDTLNWRIARAEYDLTGFRVSGGEVIYDGAAHFASVEGAIPPGLDGSLVTYTCEGSVTDVIEGRVISRVVFGGGSDNYILPEPVSVEICVLPRPVRVIWGTERLIYNGEVQAPTAYSERCTVTVEAVGRDAGLHTAVAASADPNYVIENPRLEYEIEKAENVWLSEPSLEDVFAGESPIFKGEALGGAPTLLYYEDAECTRSIAMPTEAGVYYAVAVVAESKNYGSITSEVMRFEIVTVMPIGIRATLKEGVTLRALEAVGASRLLAYVIYNNGTEGAIDSSLLGVEYEEGDTLRASDSYITVAYLGHSCRIPVSVSRAVYDMSGVVWQNTEHIYDGEPKHPTLTGLPSGVRVAEYLGTGATLAGEYKVSAILEYDRDNFEPPTVPDGRLVIGKCPVTPSFDHRPTYDGEPKSPVASELFYPTEEGTYVGAGEYKVRVELYDGANYYLTTPYASFVISPRRLRVEPSDIRLYLFERAEKFDYIITDGSVLDGEDPEIVCYESAGRIYAYSNNPNYTLDVIPGRLVSLGRLSPVASRVMLWLLFFALFIVAIAVLIIIRRGRRAVPALAARGRLAGGRRIERLTPLTPTDALAISAERADALLSDAMAKTLIRRSASVIRTSGRRSCIINVDTLGESFSPGDVVDINKLKEKGLVPRDASRLRVLGRGVLDKPLVVYANHFSLSAVKMIALTGGEVNRVSTLRYDGR
ncbi:MAG: uL15 family ribosomal protein [Clostridia bacterium]|nr:uL15 family ribosomal protein [Clostridia bacterium]